MSLLDHWPPRPFPTRWWTEWTHHSIGASDSAETPPWPGSAGLFSVIGPWFRALPPSRSFYARKKKSWCCLLFRSMCAVALAVVCPPAPGTGPRLLLFPSVWQQQYLRNYLLNGWHAVRCYVAAIKQICVCLKEGPTSVIGFVTHT